MTARLPSLALRTARRPWRAGLAAPWQPGPVLVQVPRRGYLAAIACGRCRAQARCATCGGPLEIGGSQRDARLPVVRGAGGGLDLRPLRGDRAARARHRRGTHRGGTGPRLPRRAGAHLGRPARARRRARRTRAGHRHPRGRAGGGGRLRRRAAAGRLGAARPAQPACRRGGTAPLAERGRPGPPGRVRGGAGRGDAARGAGAHPLGSGHFFRTGAG